MVRPMNGATTMKTTGFTHPATRIAEKPAFATAAPPYPPMRAWEDEVGRPPHQVIRSQQMAPSRPARITLASTTERSTNPLDRKSTRLNSSHLVISYAVFCLKKKKTINQDA